MQKSNNFFVVTDLEIILMYGVENRNGDYCGFLPVLPLVELYYQWKFTVIKFITNGQVDFWCRKMANLDGVL